MHIFFYADLLLIVCFLHLHFLASLVDRLEPYARLWAEMIGVASEPVI